MDRIRKNKSLEQAMILSDWLLSNPPDIAKPLADMKEKNDVNFLVENSNFKSPLCGETMYIITPVSDNQKR